MNRIETEIAQPSCDQARNTRAMLDAARPGLLRAYAALTSRVPADMAPAARPTVQRMASALALAVRDLDALLDRLRRDE